MGDAVILRKGWFKRQLENAEKEIETWPKWMQEAAGFKISTGTSNKGQVTKRERANGA